MAQRSDGGRALYVRQDQVVLATHNTETLLPGLGKLTVWRERHKSSGFTEQSLLAAIGAAWALDIPLNLIGAGMEAFESTEKPAGRAI